MSDDLRFALLGCGRIAVKHAELLNGQLAGGRLVAVCDIEASRANEFGKKYNVPAFDSLETMMDAMADKIDIVSVLTPSGHHPENVLELVHLGCKNIVVEKPMALTLDDAEEMIETCGRADVRLFVVKQNRYNKPIQALHNAIEEGRFGKMVMGTVRVRWCRTQEYYDQDKWRGTWFSDGGVFTNQASHHVDLLTWLLGDVDSVFSYTARQLVNIQAEDTGVAVLRFRNGALGVIEATTAARPKDLEGSISILGEHGTVEIAGFAVNEIRFWEFDEPRPEDDIIRTEYNQNPPNVYGYGHKAYLEGVIASIKKGAPAIIDGLEGMKSLQVINAIYESTETRGEVRMRFTPKHARLGKNWGRRKSDRSR